MTAATIPATDDPEQRPSGDDVQSSADAHGMTVHAVLPPPVTGMTLCTESIANAVAQRAPVRRYNWSNSSPKITWWFRFVKALRALSTPLRLLFSSRPRQAVFYMPSNAGAAVVFNLLALAAARFRGYRCVLHHHYYRYVDRFEWRIQLLTYILGSRGLEIVLCPGMERQFRAQYGQSLPLAVMPSTIQMLGTDAPPLRLPAADATAPFVMGHISNLQIAKGLDLVLAVLRELRRQGRDVRLVLAGPIDTAVERRMIEAAQTEFGPRLEYRGPVYGEAKQQFFEDIHVKIYPTQLDAQPLVIAETFAYSRPVISFGRGCIPGLMPTADWSIPPSDDFVARAVRQVTVWIDDRPQYTDACRLARRRYDELIAEAGTALDDFVRWVCGEQVEGFVRRGSPEA